jgi:hypothetical protein
MNGIHTLVKATREGLLDLFHHMRIQREKVLSMNLEMALTKFQGLNLGHLSLENGKI